MFGSLAASIPAHVTLVFPFDDPVSNEEPEVEVREATRGLAPFRVVLRGITVHEYLFLNVKRGNDAIVELHDALCRGVLAGHRSRLHTFVPHITIGRCAPTNLAAALEATSSWDAEIVGVIDRVSMYEISSATRSIVLEVPIRA